MFEILIKAIGYICIIGIAYLLKKKKLVPESSAQVFSSVMLKLTLPCAIIVSMNHQTLELSMLMIIFIGILYNALSLFIGYFSGYKNHQSLMRMINVSGYNIGCFAMPFMNGFFDTTALIVTSLFDIGNSIMCLGFNFGIASALQEQQHFHFQSVFHKVIQSVPIWTYVMMLIMSYMSIQVPIFVLPFCETVGNANPFIAMAVIGFSMQITWKKDYLRDVFQVIGVRLMISMFLAIVTYFLPLDYVLKAPLIILCFSPIGAAAVVFTGMLGLDDEKAACINSIYVLISIILMCLCISFL